MVLWANIHASFILEKPVSLLVAHIGRLEYDIYEEIGVPNSKVSIISMNSLAPENSTNVVFGVLPESKYASISTPALSVLRSSFIELVLKQLNLTLTPSIFGQPVSFELLRFPGGINVIPVQSASIWERTQILFNFTLNNSVEEVLKNLDELKDQLKFGLNLKSNENVYVEMTNENGSTVAPPVVVQASVLSDIGSGSLLPYRLKQLAQVITAPDTKNLGLNHSVFGKVKGVQLSSYLNHSISSLAPSQSPSPTPALSPSLSPSPSPSPSPPPTSFNPTLSPAPSPLSNQPSESPIAYAPSRGNYPKPPSQFTNSPSPSVVADPPKPCRSLHPSLPPYAFPPHHSANAPTPQRHKLLSPPSQSAPKHSQLAPANYGPNPLHGKRSGGAPTPSMLVSSAISSRQSYHSYWGIWLTGYLGLLLFYQL
ncbi:abl interactor homolog isoform X2 [Ananas comosus]|uniref:Abl interactor homolog isoform X2 n=1 Tax=Ananas comosus TaxID=4615 RepID=A0A6P5FBH2_ANACO|nr:abl interactor homolog isoform X2 [Ananas comosus]